MGNLYEFDLNFYEILVLVVGFLLNQSTGVIYEKVIPLRLKLGRC